MACHPEPVFTPEQEARIREIIDKDRRIVLQSAIAPIGGAFEHSLRLASKTPPHDGGAVE